MLTQGQLKLWEAGQEDDMVWGRKSIKVDNSDIGQLTTMGEWPSIKKPEEKEIVLSPDFIYVDDKGFFYPTW